MFDETRGDSELGAQVVFCFLQGFSLDHTNFSVHAVFLTAQVGQETVDSVIAGGCIVVEFAQGSPCGPAYFIFYFLAINHVGGISAWNSTLL